MELESESGSVNRNKPHHKLQLPFRNCLTLRVMVNVSENQLEFDENLQDSLFSLIAAMVVFL